MVDEDFARLTAELQDAVMRQDRQRLQELVAPGFRLITSRPGNPVTREEWIAAATGPFHVDAYTLDDVETIAAGDAVVVVHRLTQLAFLGEREAARNWLTTDVWTRATGRWQITARHTEALPE